MQPSRPFGKKTRRTDAASLFSVGQRVFHPRFGEGVVRSVGAGGDLKVYFDSFGDLARVEPSSLLIFKVGDTVRHPDYGIGIVRGFAEKSGLLNVHFDHVGGTAPVYASRLDSCPRLLCRADGQAQPPSVEPPRTSFPNPLSLAGSIRGVHSCSSAAPPRTPASAPCYRLRTCAV